MTLVEQSQEAKGKQKLKKIDPLAYFGDWKFEVHRALWPALGVSLRVYIDEEPTKAARKAAKQRGEDNVKKIAIRVQAHAVSETPVLDFHEGDVFPSKKIEGVTLQVIGQGRTGKETTNERIGKGQSYSEVLRYGIEEPD